MRLVGDNVPEQGIISTSEALKKAEELGLDLVEITAKVDPPVCKIIDYQKYLYQQKKRAKEMKANSTKVVIKEIRFGPNTDEHDFQFKLKHAIGFLQEGSKVKAWIREKNFCSGSPWNWKSMDVRNRCLSWKARG